MFTVILTATPQTVPWSPRSRTVATGARCTALAISAHIVWRSSGLARKTCSQSPAWPSGARIQPVHLSGDEQARRAPGRGRPIRT